MSSSAYGTDYSSAAGAVVPSGAHSFFPDLPQSPPAPSAPVPPSPPTGGNATTGYGDPPKQLYQIDPRTGVPNAPDDWTCTQCKNKNYARRTACNRCKAPKPTARMAPGVLSADAIAKSGGKHNPGDWACSCGNVNWAKRSICNNCQSKKPGLTDEGPREGRGGGFMEREEKVQYKSSRFVDDGDKYDDMGRLKKQYRAGAGATSTHGAPSTDGRDGASSPGRNRSRSPHGRSSRDRSRDRSPRHRSREYTSRRSRSPYRRRSRSRSPRRDSYRRDSRDRSPRRDYDRDRSYRSRSPRRDSYRRSRSPPRYRSRSRERR